MNLGRFLRLIFWGLVGLLINFDRVLADGGAPKLSVSEKAADLSEIKQLIPVLEIDDSISGIRPVIFLFLRTTDPISTTDIGELVLKAAAHVSEDNTADLEAWMENIVIIEEDTYWVISFHERANGRLVRKDPESGTFGWFIEPLHFPRLVYLAKDGLNPIEAPEGGITRSPAYLDPVSPKLRTNYPGMSEAETFFEALP